MKYPPTHPRYNNKKYARIDPFVICMCVYWWASLFHGNVQEKTNGFSTYQFFSRWKKEDPETNVFLGGGRVSNEAKHVQAHNNSITHTHTFISNSTIDAFHNKMFLRFSILLDSKIFVFLSELAWCNTWWENAFYHTVDQRKWVRASIHDTI